ncbi:MAG TPA: hypothetical protein VGY54_04040, partial [Polyangiaceae bacterium]|nr:hypothetical protein [Polyangiaceae bacterium]
MSKSTLTRRNLVAAAAALPIAAAATPSLAAGDDAELLRLAAAVETAYDALGDAIDVESVADTRLFQWRDSNPKPKILREFLDAETDVERIEEPAAAAWDEWRQREATFKRDSGHDEATAAEGVAGDKLHAAIKTLCDTRACSLRGLFAKARLCKIDPDAL